MLLLLFLTVPSVDASTPKQEITLLCLQPITGPITDFGVVGSWAQTAMLERINENPNLLPDYTIRCAHVDSGCSAGTSEQEVLGLFFKGQIQTKEWRTTPYEKDEWDTVQSPLGNIGSAEYVGLVGPACSGASKSIANFASKALKPVVSHSSTAPDLSDRAAYPYWWRSVQPDTAGLQAIGPTLAALGVEEVTVVSGPTTDAFTRIAVEGIVESGLKLVGGLPFPPEAGFAGRGLYFSNAGAVATGDVVAREEAAQLAKNFKEGPSRVVVMTLYDDAISQMLCEMSRAGVRGIIVVSVTWMFKVAPEDHPIWEHCDAADVRELMYGGIAFGPVFPRSDRGTEHGCIGGGVDPVDFLADVRSELPGLDHFEYAAPSADSVCVYAKALHELLYTEHYTLDQLNNMDQGTFNAMQAQIGAVDFEGATGRLRFKDQGDPLGLPGPDPDLFLQEIMQWTGAGLERVGLADKSGTTWSVAELKFAGFGGSEEFSFASPAPLAQFQTCLGQELDFAENKCVACPPGAESTEQGCTQCRPGFFSAGVAGADGLTACSACAPGTFTAAFGSASCTACAAGDIADGPGMTTCSACEAGTFSNADGTECTRCAVGSFQEKSGQTECSLCPATFITPGVGTSALSACTCAPRTYWNRAEDTCAPCPAEAFCAGGTSLPFVYDGFWGEHVGDVGPATLEAQEDAKASGTFVKDAAAYSHTRVYQCKSSAFCPGATMELSSFGFSPEPMQTKKNVRVGFPLVGACPQNADASMDRTGVACDKCQEGYYGTGAECVKCSGGAQGGSAVLILLVPFIMVCLYRGTTSSGTQRVQAAFILVSTCGMGAFFMQTVAVFSTFALDWPDELTWLFEISAVFMFDLNGLSVSCFHGTGFAGKYWSTICVPIFIIACTCLGYLATQVLPVPEAWKMLPNPTFSMLGMLLSALYITLVKVVVAFWECVENPAAERTLAKYKDVVVCAVHHACEGGGCVLGVRGEPGGGANAREVQGCCCLRCTSRL